MLTKTSSFHEVGVTFRDMLATLRRASWRKRLSEPASSQPELRKDCAHGLTTWPAPLEISTETAESRGGRGSQLPGQPALRVTLDETGEHRAEAVYRAHGCHPVLFGDEPITSEPLRMCRDLACLATCFREALALLLRTAPFLSSSPDGSSQ